LTETNLGPDNPAAVHFFSQLTLWHACTLLKVIIIKGEKIEQTVCTADSDGINFSILNFRANSNYRMARNFQGLNFFAI